VFTQTVQVREMSNFFDAFGNSDYDYNDSDVDGQNIDDYDDVDDDYDEEEWRI
jgi:hypothetical protein